MYNLLVGFAPGTAFGGRVFEYTEPQVEGYFKPSGTPDPARLSKLPTLVMPEVGSDEPQIALVGRLTDLAWAGHDLRYRFAPNPAVRPIPMGRIQDLATSLEIGDWEFKRTHWAVKAVDLYGTLAEPEPESSASKAFRLPKEEARERDLVAVMMPFDVALAPVYEALQGAAADAGLRCQRADDIWVKTHIMEDVLSLIWRSQVVISDFTGKNANVFYETGIAHTIGRDVIQIVQNIDDVPFDLRSIRTLTYLNNGEGLLKLRADTAARLFTLASRP
jgi:hypothetical protein